MARQAYVDDGHLVEARQQRGTRFDLEMLQELGCKASKLFAASIGRRARQPPPTLIDYLPSDALMFIDESHVTIGQLSAMYRGDRSRTKRWSNMDSACLRRWITGR